MDSRNGLIDEFEKRIVELAESISSNISNDIDNGTSGYEKSDSRKLYINEMLELLGLELAYSDVLDSTTFGVVYPGESLENTMKDQLTSVAQLLVEQPFGEIELENINFSGEMEDIFVESYNKAMFGNAEHGSQKGTVNLKDLIQLIANPNKEGNHKSEFSIPRNPEIEEALFNAENNLADWRMINLSINEEALEKIYRANRNRINSIGVLPVRALKAKGKAGRPGRTH